MWRHTGSVDTSTLRLPFGASLIAKMHIFKAGTRTDANGQTVTITVADLQKSAAVYDPTKHEAPIVVGHPRIDAPAYGWVQSLRANGADLIAQPQQLDPAFSELVQAGRYKKVSASFYCPDASANPVPGTFYLRHVGFLGATPPAVKGLKQVEFNEEEDGVVEFSDWTDSTFLSFFRGLRDYLIDQSGMETADRVIPPWMLEQLQTELVISKVTPENNTVMGFSEISGAGNESAPNPANPVRTHGDAPLPEPITQPITMTTNAQTQTTETTDFAEREAQLSSREAGLRAREIALQRAEFVNLAEGLVNEGKLLPAQKSAAVELLAALSIQEPQVVEFGEGESAFKGDLKTLFTQFLTSQPKVVNYSEVATADKDPKDLTQDPAALAKRITEYRDEQKAKGITVSFAEAQAAVLAE